MITLTERDRVVQLEADPWNPDPNATPSELEDMANAILYSDAQRLKDEVGELGHVVLLYLLDCETGYAAEIADAMAISETAVRNNIASLIEKGYVELSHEEGPIKHYKLVEGAELPEGIDSPLWLKEAQLHYRKRREIYSKSGQVDPNICEGMFDRSHPQGEVY